MLKQARYSNGSREVVVTASEPDVWLVATDSVINFPGLVELDGDSLFMSYHRGRHGGVEPLAGVVSSDLGATWQPAPDDSPFIDRHPDTGLNTMDFGSGILGYPSDGTITRIDTYPLENYQEPYLSADGPHHLVQQRADSTFQLRRWSKSGELLELHPFKVEGFPWEVASYENYSRLIELDNGDYMTVFEHQVGPPEVLDGLSPSGRQMVQYSFSCAVIRSSDRGQTWRFVEHFHPDDHKPVYGLADREVDEGFDEPDVIQLDNGDILCMMRTGSYSPMFQSRSTDGGATWSAPESTGWQGVKPRLQKLDERRPGLRGRTRRLRSSPGHARDAEPGRHGRALGVPVRLPHRSGLFIHVGHAARRQVARGVFAIGFHARVGHERTAGRSRSGVS